VDPKLIEAVELLEAMLRHGMDRSENEYEDQADALEVRANDLIGRINRSR